MITKNNRSYGKAIVSIMVVILILLTSILSAAPVNAQKMKKKESFPNANKAKNEEPETLGTSACLIDAKSGYMIYGVDENEKAYPASTTKIMTALLTVENLDPDDVVTVDAEAEAQGGSQLYLEEGQQMKVSDLLYGMMLPSANDAALALGHAVGGTTANFAKLMNQKAKNIGAVNSHFVNPNGLPDSNHYTTAYDLALIAREAMKYDAIRKVVSTYEYTLPKTNMSDAQLIHNRNRLLYNVNRKVESYGETKSIKYDGVTGIKTGFTNKAQFCLVGSAKHGNTELIAVTMKTKDMNGYYDVVSMLDYGFNNFKTVELMKPGEAVENLKVDGGKDKYAEASLIDGLYATLPVSADADDIKLEEKYTEPEAPYDAGIDGGTIEVYYKDNKVGEAKVSITEPMEKGNFFDNMLSGDGFGGILFKIIIVLAILVLIVLILRAINKGRRRRARRRRNRRGKK